MVQDKITRDMKNTLMYNNHILVSFIICYVCQKWASACTLFFAFCLLELKTSGQNIAVYESRCYINFSEDIASLPYWCFRFGLSALESIIINHVCPGVTNQCRQLVAWFGYLQFCSVVICPVSRIYAMVVHNLRLICCLCNHSDAANWASGL